MSDEAPRHLKRVVMRGAAVSGLGYFLAQALSLAAYLAIARLVTPDEYGVYVAGSLVTGIGVSVSGGGLQAAVIQRRERVDEAAATAVISSFAAGVALALVSLAAAPLVAAFFHSGQAGAISAALSGWAVLRCAAIVPNALMQRRFSFLRRLVVEPFGILTFGIVSIVATANGMGAWGLVIGTYASATVQLCLSWGLARWRPRLTLASYQTWREITRFARPLFAAEVLRRVSVELPSAVVGRYLGADALGQYRYGERFGTQPQGAVTNVAAYVLLPAFARIADDADADRLRRAFLRALRWITVVAMPTGFIMLPLGEPLAVALLGERWHQAGYVMMGFFAFTGASALAQVAIETFKAVGRPDLVPRVRGLSAAATAAGVVAALPLGIAGVAVGVSLSAVVVGGYAAAVASRIIGIPIRAIAAEIWPAGLASLVMVAAVEALDSFALHAESRDTVPALGLLAMAGLSGVLVYAVMLHLLAPATAAEFRAALRVGARRVARRSPRSVVARPERR